MESLCGVDHEGAVLDEAVFNFHDLVLLITAFECLVISLVLASKRMPGDTRYLLLAGIFIAHSLIALHELILWGATFRHWVLDHFSNLFFVFNVAYLLDGPLIYLFVVSLAVEKFKFRNSQLMHLAPVGLFIMYMYLAFWGLEEAQKRLLIVSYDFAYSWHYVAVDLLIKIQRIGYVALALVIASRSLLSERPAPIQQVQWARPVLMVFLSLLSWETMLTLLKVYNLFQDINHDMLEIIGLADYYAMLLLVNAVVYLASTRGIGKSAETNKHEEPVNEEYLARIEAAMTKEKPYLDPMLSLERLSEQVDVPAKDLSYCINRHFGVNFYEYINRYRINEARMLLEQAEYADTSITEIFYTAGFSSKSVYNTMFRKMYKCTPSEYRKRALK